MSESIPLLILGGSDGRHGPVPPTLEAADLLSGYKGAYPLGNGRCLVAELIDRYRQSGRFADPILLGPKRVFSGLVDCEIVSVEGSLVDTLSGMFELMRQRFDSQQPVAISACDILPTIADIGQLMDERQRAAADSAFWWQIIVAEPAQMGASDWKPRYGLRLENQGDLHTAYPGHVVVLRPGSVRTELLVDFLGLCYRYRNLPIHKRLLPMLLRGLGLLLAKDVRNLGRGQFPLLAATIPWHIVRAYQEIRGKRLSIDRFERHAARVVLHRDFRVPGSVVISPTRLLAFAKDIDSQVELDDLQNRFHNS